MGEHCLLQHILLLQYTPLTAVHLTAAHLTPLYTAGSAPHPPLCRQWTESVRVITQFRPPALARVDSILLKFYILPFFMKYIFLAMLMDRLDLSLFTFLVFSSSPCTNRAAEQILGDSKKDQLLWQTINWPTFEMFSQIKRDKLPDFFSL